MDKTPKNKIRLIPYGMSDFARIRRENKYYVDKTMFIPRHEEFSFQMFLRPRRYGKSLMLNMLAAYYDVAYKDQFDDLFGGLYIGENPMVDKNVSSDYNKMAALIRFEKQFGEKTSIIQRINNDGQIYAQIEEEFSLKDLDKYENLVSLMYYMGLLTIGEAFVKGFFLCQFGTNLNYFVAFTEHYFGHGYTDLYLKPQLGTPHAYIIELKYVKHSATDAEVKAKLDEARTLLPKYISDKNLLTEAKDGNWTLHPIILVFKGWELAEYEVME